ncbi:MAG: hypothetical protein JEZ01_05950 [Labilibaculum sp.]|nr:hypothetical protein [Labilibaculum sp.]MBI9057296.1 hypothetical protein [Labilibaculum sp.]
MLNNRDNFGRIMITHWNSRLAFGKRNLIVKDNTEDQNKMIKFGNFLMLFSSILLLGCGIIIVLT